MRSLPIVLRRALPVLSLLALPACFAEPADDEELEPPRLIAAVDRPSGNRVEFFASADGDLLVSETGPADNLPTLPPVTALRVDPARYYRALADGAEPPAELVELAAAREGSQDDGAPLVFTDGPRPVVGGAPRSASWFEDRACDKYNNSQMEWCLLNRRDDGTKSHSDVNGVYGVVLVDDGEVDFDARTRPWYSWSTSTWTVRAGHWRSWWDDGTLDFDFQSRVRNAEGDRYHHAGMACWGGGGVCPVWAPL